MIENKKIAILLGTFNGERHLRQQLESIASQKYLDWVVYASDDGSSDDTLAILADYQKVWGLDRLKILSGPRSGFAANFISLATNQVICADFYAFCDQDDVWLPEKLNIAVANILQNEEPGKPYLYCGRTFYFSEKIFEGDKSPLFSKPPGIRNALVQCIAGGNTMVFNNETKKILLNCRNINVVSHDWWLYILVTATSGSVFYDPIPQIFYRQHSNSLVGRNDSMYAKYKRLVLLLNGRFRQWNGVNLLALESVSDFIELKNRRIINMFIKARNSNPLTALLLCWKCGLYRQTVHGSISLFIAILLKRV